jgi:hypothetical protein
LEAQPSKSNYFIGSNPNLWRRGISHFGRVEYGGIYKGIDLTYYGTGQRLEYDFVVRPHADPRTIRLQFEGADQLRIDENGDLVLKVGKAEIRERKPVAYQDMPEGRVVREVHYVALSTNRIGFEVASYDRAIPLVIDPVLVFSTYFGGTGKDITNRVALDSAGNIYYGGSTSSSNLAGTKIGQPFTGGLNAAFIAKSSPSGSLVFTTFIAGLNDLAGVNGIAVDASGNVYASGSTRSASFPLASPLQPTFGGGVSDAFVFELNSTGSSLVFSTFLGGNGQDYTEGLAIDNAGTVYVAGTTLSTNFPLANATQKTMGGNHTAFAAKIAPGGTSLLYSTYYGGSGGDYNNGMALDSGGNLYFYGDTTSTNFPALNAIQPTPCGGTAGHGWVAQLNSAGSPVYSTYICGSASDDSVRGAALDPAGNLVITGATSSTTFPLLNPIQSSYGGGSYDSFVTKLSPSGGLLYSTYLGGNGTDTGLGLATDSVGNLYVTGNTSSTNFPLANPLQSSNAGGNDVFLTKVNAAGSAIVFSTYLGGNQGEASYGVAVDANGQAYIAGQTASTNFPTAHALQPAFGGGTNDAFWAVLATCDFSLSSPSAATAGGGSASISVSTTPECGWTASTNSAWITVTTRSGSGPGTASYSVASNTGGPRSGNLTVGTQTVTISQSGMLSPSALAFGSQGMGVTSTAQTITLTAPGPGALSISSISFAGANATDFAQTNTCPVGSGSLSPGATCSIAVTFTPSTAAAENATLSISGTGFSSPVTENLTGTGAASTVSLSPGSITFGNQSLTTTSAATPMTVTNNGPGLLTISSIGITGANAGDFAQTNNCPVSPATLAVSGICTINVTFTPTAAGARSGIVSITDNGASSPQTASLSGTGVVPAVSLSPASLSFGNQNLNTASSPMTVTVTNNGPGVLSISSIGFTGTNSGDYSQTNNCPISPATLAVSGSCTVNVTFTPSVAGASSASLNISDNAASSPQSASLSGTGVNPGPTVALSPSSLSFGNQTQGTASASQSITVTNSGPGLLTISSVGLSGTNAGDFAQTNNCPVSPATLAVSSSCTVNVTFTPTATGARAASLSITDNGSSSPQSASLSGTGVLPAVTLSPTSLSFGNQNLNTTSGAMPVTITNSGPGMLTISTIGISGGNPGDFAQTNNCPVSPATLAVSASCTVNVTFMPTAAGARSASVSVTDNGAASPQSVSLTGTGAVPTVTLSPTSLSFGNQNLNTASSPMPVTVTNSGPGLLTISSIAISGTNAGDFAETDNCPISPATLAVSASCTVNVTFTPTAAGARSASISITDNGASSPQSAGLAGTGVVPVPTVTLSPSSVSFGNQNVGTTSGAIPVTVTNNGPGTLSISTIGITGINAGDFPQTNNCPISPATLAVSSSCTVNLTFTPTASGARSASLFITDNGASSPQSTSLSGTGVVPTVTLSPTSVSFGNQNLGTTSGVMTVTVTNSGPGLLAISSIGITGANAGDFAQTNNCPISPAALVVYSSCTVNLTFTPAASGARSASLFITDNGASSPQSASLSGNGAVPTVTLSPTSLSFGTQNLNTTSGALPVTVTNSGPGVLSISSIGITGTNAGDFAQTNNCPVTLAVSSSCTVSVTFTPLASGTRSAALSITDNGASSPQSASLSGTGAMPVVNLSPASLSFGGQPLLTTSASKTVTVTNSGPGSLSISSITFTGTNSGDFAQTNNCPTSPATLAVSGTCTVTVAFTPVGAGARSASLTITDNGASSPQKASVTGTGVAPTVSLSPTSLSFGNQTVATTSAPMTLTVTNSGPGPLSISSITMGGGDTARYTQTNNCPISPVTLAASGSCTVSVTFRPPALGTFYAYVSIADNGGSSPQTANVSGTGVVPSVGLSPSSLAFGNQTVATTSAPQTITITNNGAGMLTITAVAINGTNKGDFAQTNNCVGTLAVGTTCSVNVTFTPSATGSRTATLAVTDNGLSSPQSAALSGTGQ